MRSIYHKQIINSPILFLVKPKRHRFFQKPFYSFPIALRNNQLNKLQLFRSRAKLWMRQYRILPVFIVSAGPGAGMRALSRSTGFPHGEQSQRVQASPPGGDQLSLGIVRDSPWHNNTQVSVGLPSKPRHLIKRSAIVFYVQYWINSN